ncbi:MAG: hypothetical protein AB7I18_05720 [Candidatus Berkiella sp.]
MNNLCQTAENIYYGLLWGLCTVKDCVMFADDMINTLDSVPYPIIELSLSTTTTSAMNAIKPLITTSNKFEVYRFVLGRMHYLGLQEPERLVHFANLLFQEAITMEYKIPDEFELFTMDHEYEIADVLGNNYENANHDFLQALLAFRKENSHSPDWFAVN